MPATPSRSSAAAALLATVALLAAGCSQPDEPAPEAEGPSCGWMVQGVVVDAAIRPVTGATVTLRSDATEQVTTTAADGRFLFQCLPAGAYFVTASHPFHAEAQVVVEAGPDVPEETQRIRLGALAADQPYATAQKFSGFILCGFDVGIASQCANDHTTLLVPGGLVPQLRGVLGDVRGYLTDVPGGWATIVLELTWDPSVNGTAPWMSLVVSFANRTSAHRFASVEGPDPVLVRLDAGTPHATAREEPLAIPPEGMQDVEVFGVVRAEQGTPAAVGVQQEFELLQHVFFNAPAPLGWAFLAGDEPP